ncbi:RGS domain-containing protein [Mortierella sp. GBAus27b]|nr:hypothetical protein BGX31_001617 [Mortierella sp. GBA43]KAI8357026.1 RGS domain-containing protein [Mortierella sp. GBAus27b]
MAQRQSLHRSISCGSYGPPLHEILSDQTEEPYSLNRFAQFLQSQFCHENLAFWLASRQYKLTALALQQDIQETSPEFNLHQSTLQFLTQAQTRRFSDLQSEMLVILEMFILPDSEYELNLSDTIRSRLLKAVTDGDYHSQVLEQARVAITDLMKSSSYPLFLESISNKDSPASTSSSPALTFMSSTSARFSSLSSSNSSSSSASTHTQDDSERDRSSWRLKAKEHFKLVSKALRKNGL